MKKTIAYKDGNVLSYAEFGHPCGYPVLIQHGLVASIRDECLFGRLAEAGARLISIARPGYGDSSPYVMRDVAEWGDVVSVLVDELGLAQFDILGISSGAPYAYAIGYRCPERAQRLFILSGTPALYDDSVLSYWPYPVDRNAGIADLQALAHELFFSHLSQQDSDRDDVRDSMVNNCFGIAQDLRIRCRDWGFPLSAVKTRVHMRHSKADDAVPFITAELTSRLLPDCTFEARDNDPHFSPEVLDHFIATVMARRYERVE